MTLTFGIIAALLVLITVATLLIPFLRTGNAVSIVERGDANLELLRDQLSELDADLRNGVLSEDQYENARADLERRVLEESPQSETASLQVSGARRWVAPAVVAILVPVLSALFYLNIGSVDGLNVDQYVRDQAAAITPDQVESMVSSLAQRLEREPGDVEGWAMLGRSYLALQRYPESAQAWHRAAMLQPDNPDILVNYAEALGFAAQGNFDGEPGRLLERAVVLDPSHPKALALSGGAAFGRGDYQVAIDFWQRLLSLSGNDEELSSALRSGIARAQALLSDGAESTGVAASITGIVSLSPEISASASADDAVFIFVRAANGPRMPLAVDRVKVEDLPYDFVLDDSMAMTPDKKISDFQELVVGARVSGSGSASRSSGDLEGFSAPVGPLSSDIRVQIDRRVP